MRSDLCPLLWPDDSRPVHDPMVRDREPIAPAHDVWNVPEPAQLPHPALRGRREIADPKTMKGKRRVELPDLAVEALKAHRRRLKATPHPESWVFTDSRGGTLRRSNFLRRNWAPLLARAGLRGVRFHDLRHTCASLLLAAGTHPKVVQERLGHATIAITLDTYSHVVGSLQRDAADSIDEILG